MLEIWRNFEYLIDIILLMPLLTLAVIYFIKEFKLTKFIFLVTLNVFQIILIVLAIIQFNNNNRFILEILSILPNLNLSFSVDLHSLIFVLFINILWCFTYIYAYDYFNCREHHFSYFAVLSLFISQLMAFAENNFTLFCFYELLTITSFPLILLRVNNETISTVKIYIFILIGLSSCFFFPILVLTNNLPFTLFDSDKVNFFMILAFLGIGKNAYFPIYTWLIKAMKAETPVSGLFHAVIIVKSGIFALYKVATNNVKDIFDLEYIYVIAVICLCTVIISSIYVLYQHNLKKILAYSTISNLALMSMTITIPNSGDILMKQILAHGFAKIILFFVVGNIYLSTKRTDITHLYGVGKKMKLSLIPFFLASLSLIGFPFLPGFIAKFDLLKIALIYDRLDVLVALIISTFVSSIYLGRIMLVMIAPQREEIIFFRYNSLMNFVQVMLSLMMIILVICMLNV